MKTIRSSISLAFVAVVLASMALLPQVQAVVPPPDGGYPGFTTAEGDKALFSLTSGAGNTALGWRALFLDSTGSFNTGVGAGALILNTGDNNTAVGTVALLLNTGSGNTAVGEGALNALLTGSLNTALGIGAGSADAGGETNNIYLGDTGFAGDTNVIAIGALAATGIPYANCYIGGIVTQAQVTDGVTVCEVSVRLADGRLGIDCTHPSNPGSAPQGVPRGNSTAPVPRAQFQAMNDKVEKLQATVAQQQKQIETLTVQLREQAETFTAQLKEQATQIQKVSAQLELSKSTPQTVLNNR